MKQFLVFILLSQLTVAQENSNQEFNFDHLKNHPLGGISEGYQLTLTGYFDDCGEFGGHKEIILLKREDRELIATLTIYEKDCNRRSGYEEIKIIEQKSYKISEGKALLFNEYLEKLLTMSLRQSVPFHAGRHYYATLDFKGEETRFRNVDLHYHDTGWNWTEFEKLKENIDK